MLNGSGKPKFYLSVYYQKEKDLGDRPFETQIHKIRDGLAIAELISVFYEAHYFFGGTILNIPKAVQDKLAPERIKDETRQIGIGDIVLLPTRPALDDDASEIKRPIRRSESVFEENIFKSMRTFFQTCDRSQIILSPHLKPDTNDERVQEFRVVSFYQTGGGRVQKLNALRAPRSPAETRLTLGYLVSVPTVPPYGFRLLVAFGLGGTETLWFSHLLRLAYPQYLHQAIRSEELRMWMVPFLVPDYAPYPFLQADLSYLRPKREYSNVISWSLAPNSS
jgi:hypothetical protein